MTSGDSASASLEEVLARLEGTIAELADGTAPLDELVSAHQRAAGLLTEAEGRLEVLKARAERLVSTLQTERPTPPAPARRE